MAMSSAIRLSPPALPYFFLVNPSSKYVDLIRTITARGQLRTHPGRLCTELSVGCLETSSWGVLCGTAQGRRRHRGGLGFVPTALPSESAGDRSVLRAAGSQHLSDTLQGELPPIPAHGARCPHPWGCCSARRGCPSACSSASLIGILSPLGGSRQDGSGVTAVTGNACHGDGSGTAGRGTGAAPAGSVCPRWDV